MLQPRQYNSGGMAASFHFRSLGFPFKESAGWVQDFKKECRIRERHKIKYINSKDNMTLKKQLKLLNCVQTDSYNDPRL
jgi:DNA primase